jgi:ornithine carbamoyltransferase
LSRDPQAVARGADVVVTDTWISMGQDHAEEKLAAMMPYQVTPALMALAKPTPNSSTACPPIAARKWSMP